MVFQAKTQAEIFPIELPPRIPKKKSNLFSPFSQIEKEAKDDEDEPPRLEVRKKGSPRKSPKKTPRKRKAPELVKVPKAIATDEEPGTSSGKCHITYSQHGLHYIDRGWDCQNYNCRRLSLYPMIFSVRRSFLEPRNCHCRQLSLTDDDLYLARYLMLIICFSVISFRHQQLHEQRGFWLSVRL